MSVMVVTADQRGSRRDHDRVTAMLVTLDRLPLLVPFERTVGDRSRGWATTPQP